MRMLPALKHDELLRRTEKMVCYRKWRHLVTDIKMTTTPPSIVRIRTDIECRSLSELRALMGDANVEELVI